MVHDHGGKQNQAERDKASDEQEQTTDNLEYGNDVKVMAQENVLVKSPAKIGGGGVSEWNAKNVRTEHDKNESEKNPGNNRRDFHSHIVT
jgi:uncharacterized protein YaiL (DUF2058 family)